MGGYEFETYELKKSRFPLALAVVYLLFLSGTLVDYLVISEQFHLSVLLRLGFVAVTLVLLVLTLRRRPSPVWFDKAPVVILYGAALVMAVLIRISGGYRSIHLEGLIELALLWGILFPWKPRQYLPHLAVIWGLYLFPCLLLDRPFTAGPRLFLCKNLEYLIFAGICLIAIVLNESLRYKEYLQRSKLSRTIRTDALTQALNYRGFWTDLQNCIELARAQNHSLALILMDLDNFKAYNDTRGHLVGDALLRDTALILKESVRSSDMVYRQGGDEFAIILPQADLAVAQEVVRRIEDRFSHHLVSRGALDQVGLSIGIAEYPTNGHDAEQLYWHADHHLFEIKKNKKTRETSGK